RYDSPRGGKRAALSVTMGWLLALTWFEWGIAADTPADRELFESKIRPVLVEHCYKCHSVAAGRPKSGLRLDTREGLRRGGVSGRAIVPGDPDQSLLIQAIAHDEDVEPMPPKGKLPASVVADFRQWVARGAFDPRDSAATAGTPAVGASETWWSL